MTHRRRVGRSWESAGAAFSIGVVLLCVTFPGHAEWVFDILWGRMPYAYSIDERVGQFGGRALVRLAPDFAAAQVPLPPAHIAFLVFKDTRVLELHARTSDGYWRLVRTYPILAASGEPGPKLREGDQQVPEGIYPVTLLNPNSRFHVSLRLGYPNAFDRQMAQADGRSHLGGDIMIHGSAMSIGCLAMGDEAAEEFFVLAVAVGLDHVKVVISPTDFRRGGPAPDAATLPAWAIKLYTELASELAQYPAGS